MNKRRVVITGLGTVNPIGNNKDETLTALKAGKNGIGPITKYDLAEKTVTLAAEVKELNLKDYIGHKELRRMDLSTAFAIVAAREAMEDSQLTKEMFADSIRYGVTFSSGIGGMQTMEDEILKGGKLGFERISPFFIPKVISNMSAGHIAIELGLHGEATCPVTACAGSTNAIGEAFRKIRDNYADVVFAGGTEAAITESGMGGFTNMRALATTNDPNRASIPFDQEREGFVMGEGAAVLVLEEYEHAKKRNAEIYAEIVGYGASCDGYHITAPKEDGYWAAKAMQEAIDDGGLSAADITSVNTHGTSTSLNDACETMAMKTVFGDQFKNVYVNATKSMTGHLLGAAGAVEGLISVLQLKHQFLAPTINHKIDDPECDVNLVKNQAIDTEVNYVMSNSLGFGGHNHSVVFKKWEE